MGATIPMISIRNLALKLYPRKMDLIRLEGDGDIKKKARKRISHRKLSIHEDKRSCFPLR